MFVLITSFVLLTLNLNLNGNCLELPNNTINKKSELPPVSQQCMGCICEAMSGCGLDMASCRKDVCGPYRITKGYWADAYQVPEPTNDLAEYERCAKDLFCSFNMVQEHMRKYRKDCNGDNVVNCVDFLAIHYLGRMDCEQFFRKNDEHPYVKTLEKCLRKAKTNLLTVGINLSSKEQMF
ncbi:invertebrate-type lysozyme 3-like [Condylostylus longicornis]|uniref:invertebrate-type lysozyme 3-like n=1 Tax=Condylostylus longicornis TaxID=2530218 RepID=UPI00244DFF24|nr:invertebrate-type lysozyme 3-like [Condylostylus longicornis]